DPVWSLRCDPDLLRAPRAVAAGGHWLAVVDADRVLVWAREGDQLSADIAVPAARLAALTRHGGLLGRRDGRTALLRYGPDGTARGRIRTGAPGRVIGIRVGPGRTGWLLTEDGSGLHLSRGRLGGGRFQPAELAELAAALRPSRLVAAWSG